MTNKTLKDLGDSYQKNLDELLLGYHNAGRASAMAFVLRMIHEEDFSTKDVSETIGKIMRSDKQLEFMVYEEFKRMGAEKDVREERLFD